MAFSQDGNIILVKISEDNPTVYVPSASKTVKGIASFEDVEFVVTTGHVQLGSDYAELPDIVDAKVDKSDTAGLHAYTHNGDEDGEVPISIEPVEDTLVQRDNNGVIKSKEGVSNNDVIIKSQLTAIVQDFVKSVNGEGPDDNGDVYIDTARDPKLYDALLLTDQNSEPLEDQDGRYIAPPEVDEYARAGLTALEEKIDAAIQAAIGLIYAALSQHAYDKMEAHIKTTTYHIIDPYGELDKIYVGDTLTWSKYPQNVVVFLSDEARTITPTYTQEGVTLQFSIDEGSNWVNIASRGTTPSSKEIWFRGQATGLKSLYSSGGESNAWSFSSPHTSLRVKGNLNYLLCDTLGDTDAPLVAASNCYREMFNGCTSLIEAPSLPAIALEGYCYRYMFNGCTSLVEAPALPATALQAQSYAGMFRDCTSLVNAPALPATTLNSYCYSGMFRGCTSLVDAPVLPATVLWLSCYSNMFNGCTSLVEAPELPSTASDTRCYEYMFYGCTSLVKAPALLPATDVWSYCYSYMFNGCISLEEAPALPATSLGSNCYEDMFNGCTSLVNAPALPATVLMGSCYRDMFNGCTSLVKAPELLATDLQEQCYAGMFRDCTSLVEIKLGYKGTYTPYTIGWVNGIATQGTLYKAGVQFDASGASTYPTTWTQVPWTP